MSYINKVQKLRSKLGLVVLFVFSIIGLLFSVIEILGGVSGGQYWPTKIFIASFLWLIIYFSAFYSYFRSLYLFSSAYLIGVALFHLGLIYLITFGLAEVHSWVKSTTSIRMEIAGWYVFLSFCSFGIGAVIGVFTSRRNNISVKINNVDLKKTNNFIFLQGVGLSLAALIFLVWAISSYGNILAYSREELFNVRTDTRGFGVFMMVLPGALILLTVSASTKIQRLFVYPLTLFFFLLMMLSGYRSAALFPSLVGIILWVKTGRKIPAVVALSFLSFVLVAIAVVGVFRQMGAYQDLGTEQLASSYEKVNVVDSFVEMGASFGVLSEVIKFIPNKDPFRYGYSYWQALKEMIPNIGFSIDSSKSRRNKSSKASFDKSALMELTPADWITYKLNRWKFDHGQGVGFSAIAEPYFNFGIVGVIGYFGVLGFLLSRLDQKNIILHPYVYLLVGSVFWTFMRTVRNDFINFTKPLGFIIIILLIYNLGLVVLGKRVKFSIK